MHVCDWKPNYFALFVTFNCLTLSCMMLKNGPADFENLVVWTLQGLKVCLAIFSIARKRVLMCFIFLLRKFSARKLKSICWEDWVSKPNWKLSVSYRLVVVKCLKISLILTSLLECIADQINEILIDREQLPVWFTCGGAYLYIKDLRRQHIWNL